VNKYGWRKNIPLPIPFISITSLSLTNTTKDLQWVRGKASFANNFAEFCMLKHDYDVTKTLSFPTQFEVQMWH